MIKVLALLTAFGVLFSCGKKEKSASEEGQVKPLEPSEREDFLNKQELLCEAGTYCPDYVAKIVVFDKGSPRFCTGTLISKNQLLTSASCLPSYLRTTDSDCSKDVFFFFGKGNRPPERMGCKSIQQVSSLDGNLAEYWRDDVAVLELEKNLNWREFKDVSRRGLGDGGTVRFFAVSQETDFTGVIRKEECEVVLNSYLYPLSSTESSPNILLAGCKRKQGYRGAAILDSFPRIRAVLSDNSSLRSALENSSLLIKPLKDFIHVSNFACAPLLDATQVLDEQECAKPLDYASVANGRSRLLSDEVRYGDIVAKLEKTADSASKYLRMQARITPVDDRHIIDFKPVCFKNVNSWLSGIATKGSFDYEAVMPNKTLRKGVDSYGRAVTQDGDDKTIKYYLNFSPKRLSKEKLSDVFFANDNTDTVRVSGLKACN